MHNHEQRKWFIRSSRLQPVPLIMKSVLCERFINVYMLIPKRPHFLLVIALLSISSYLTNAFALQHHIPSRRRVANLNGDRNPSYYYRSATARDRLRIGWKKIGALPVVKRDTPETEIDSSDLLRKYKIRSSILEHEIRSKTKELSSQKSKVIILQEVVLKMKARDGALMEKLASLKKGVNSTNIPSSKEYSDRRASTKADQEEDEREIAIKQQRVDLERNERKMRELQEELRNEEQKRSSISERCEEMTGELDCILEKHRKEIESYRKKSDEDRVKTSEMQDQIFSQKLEISRFREVSGKNQRNIDYLQRQKLKEECDRLGGQITSLESQCASYQTQIQNQSKIYELLRNETNLLLREENIKLSGFQTEIAHLENDKLGVEIALNDTRKAVEKLRRRITNDEIRKTSENQRKNREDILSKEAMLIATAAVQQSEEREQELKHKLGLMQRQLEDLGNQRDRLQENMVSTQKRYKEEVMETERRHQQHIQTVVEIQEDVKEKYALLKSQHEQTKLSYEKRQLLDRAHWEKKLLKVENSYDVVVESIKQEIGDLTQRKGRDIKRNDSEIEGSCAIIEETDNEVSSKQKSIGALWCRIWFRKRDE